MERDDINWDSMAYVSNHIHEWANRTFPGRSPVAALTKLTMEEIPELLIHRKQHGQNGIGGELADCFILLFDLAQIWDVDLPRAIRDKMEINERRMWTKDVDTGHYNHWDGTKQIFSTPPPDEQDFNVETGESTFYGFGDKDDER